MNPLSKTHTPLALLLLVFLTSGFLQNGVAGLVPVSKTGPSPLVLAIGNDKYENAVPLRNAGADALAIASLFCSASGRSIESSGDLSGAEIHAKLNEWTKQGQSHASAKDGNLAVFYFAGHSGMDESSGAGILGGVDLEEPTARDPGAVPAEVVVEAAHGLAKDGWDGVLIFDCDMPFQEIPLPPPGWAYLFAGQPGKATADGVGAPHSPFTQALINCITGAALTSKDGQTVRLNTVLAAVLRQVAFATKDRQVPVLVTNQFDAVLKVIPSQEAKTKSEDATR